MCSYHWNGPNKSESTDSKCQSTRCDWFTKLAAFCHLIGFRFKCHARKVCVRLPPPYHASPNQFVATFFFLIQYTPASYAAKMTVRQKNHHSGILMSVRSWPPCVQNLMRRENKNKRKMHKLPRNKLFVFSIDTLPVNLVRFGEASLLQVNRALPSRWYKTTFATKRRPNTGPKYQSVPHVLLKMDLLYESSFTYLTLEWLDSSMNTIVLRQVRRIGETLLTCITLVRLGILVMRYLGMGQQVRLVVIHLQSQQTQICFKSLQHCSVQFHNLDRNHLLSNANRVTKLQVGVRRKGPNVLMEDRKS